MKKFLLSLSLLFLFACGGSKEEPSKTENKTETTKVTASNSTENQELNLLLNAEPKSLDPSRSSDTYSSIVLVLTNEGLVGSETNAEGQDTVVPAGAESWTVSDDNLVWTFNLRKDAVWADGKPVTADQYYYGITRTLDPNTGSSYAFLLYPIKGAKEFNSGNGTIEDVGIKVVDDHTLEITLDNATPYFNQLGYFKVMYPQRKDVIEKFGEAYGSEGNHILSNGPYIMKEWVHNSKIALEKNPTYWDAANHKLDKINLMIVTDENSRLNLLASGQADLGYTDKPEWMEQFRKSGDFSNIKRSAMGTNYSIFNTTSTYFKNPKIRKAFSLALNREEINKVMFNDNFEPGYGFVTKGIGIGDKEYRSIVPEPLRKLKEEYPDPKVLLVEGLTELGMDPNPANMSITYLSSGTSSWSRKYSELLQQMLKTNLGVDVKAEFVEWPVYQKRNNELDYEMGGQAWTGDYNDPNTFLDMWASSAAIVPTGWANAEYDELIAKAAVTADQAERLKYFERAENILLYEDSVIAPTLYRMTNTFYRNYVKNYNPTPIAAYNYKGVYIEGRE